MAMRVALSTANLISVLRTLKTSVRILHLYSQELMMDWHLLFHCLGTRQFDKLLMYIRSRLFFWAIFLARCLTWFHQLCKHRCILILPSTWLSIVLGWLLTESGEHIWINLSWPGNTNGKDLWKEKSVIEFQLQQRLSYKAYWFWYIETVIIVIL